MILRLPRIPGRLHPLPGLDRTRNPLETFSKRRRGRTVGSSVVFVAELDVGDEKRQELEPREKLMGTLESRVELPPIDHHATIEILKPGKRDRGALHVLECRLELGLVSPSDETVRVNPESGVGPFVHHLNTCVIDHAAFP